MLLLYLVTTFCAIVVNLSNPDIEPVESVIIWAAMNQAPTVVGALLVAASSPPDCLPLQPSCPWWASASATTFSGCPRAMFGNCG